MVLLDELPGSSWDSAPRLSPRLRTALQAEMRALACFSSLMAVVTVGNSAVDISFMLYLVVSLGSWIVPGVCVAHLLRLAPWRALI